MKLKMIGLFLLVSAVSQGQKNVVVKKGEIKVNGEKVADYDGKDGNAFRMGKFRITLPGSATPVITIEEDALYLNNPLFEKTYWLYQVKFADGDSFFFRPEPVVKKFMGNTVTLSARKKDNDIITEFFNDGVPVILTTAGLDKKAVAELKSAKAYAKDKLLQEAKDAEDAIGKIHPVNVERDKSKPVVFTTEKSKDDLGTWFLVSQDGKTIGRLYKRLGNEAIYEVWKKAPAGFQLLGKEAEYAPLVITDDLKSGNGVLSKKFDAMYVSGKKTFQFTSSDPANAERDLVTALIAAGVL